VMFDQLPKRVAVEPPQHVAWLVSMRLKSHVDMILVGKSKFFEGVSRSFAARFVLRIMAVAIGIYFVNCEWSTVAPENPTSRLDVYAFERIWLRPQDCHRLARWSSHAGQLQTAGPPHDVFPPSLPPASHAAKRRREGGVRAAV